jgi:hypothetical protein
MARGFLESHGVEAVLADENTCRNAWLPVPILGGIRLQVRGEDAAIARGLLAAVATPSTPE